MHNSAFSPMVRFSIRRTKLAEAAAEGRTMRHTDNMTLTLADPPTSGLGDRLGAWVALLGLARLRNESVLLRDWRNSRHAGGVDGQHNQNTDVAMALACIEWPPALRA